MSLVLLEGDGVPPYVAGIIALVFFFVLLAIVRGVGQGRPHS